LRGTAMIWSFSRLFRKAGRRPCRQARRLPLSLEALEDRCVPAIATWDGGGGDNNATTPANWAGDTAPVAGDDLVFPSGVAQLAANNDFTDGTEFSSLSFDGDGYVLDGNGISLANGITASNATGTTTINVPLTLAGPQTVDVQTAGTTVVLQNTITLN